jgi:large conductance mechanosensitive channel
MERFQRLRMSGFREFILRGNVVDLAVGIVIGAAFTSVVHAFVNDFLTPLIGIGLKPAAGFGSRHFTVDGGVFHWGDFVQEALTFLLVALVVYYLVVLPVNRLMQRYRSEPPAPAPQRTCPECKSSIPVDATRCAFCTILLPA